MTLKPDPMGAQGAILSPKLTPKGLILTLFQPKCIFFIQLVQISSKHVNMVLYISNHTSMVIFFSFMALSRSKIDPKRVNFDAI